MLAILLASCGNGAAGDSAATAPTPPAEETAEQVFDIAEFGSFTRPWAAAFEPGTDKLFITEKPGTMKFVDTANGYVGTVTGLPTVAYAGQGGLGDVAFAPDYATSRMIYLSWAEAGAELEEPGSDHETRGAAVGRGILICETENTCAIQDLAVIWWQFPKVTGAGHYSHRIAFSPDGKHLFLSSGDRQKMDPAQDRSNTIGTVVRLNLDGTPAAGNPFAAEGSPTDEIWSFGHRNILGMDFDANGRLWEIEHGPRGGDELNLVKPGKNYGWPLRSYGVHYNGNAIPDHTPDDGFEKPKVWWTPVIAPGDMALITSTRFQGWQGDMLIAGLKSKAIVRVDITGDEAREVARYDMGNRIRAVVEGPDGALWVLEDGDGGRLLKLTPKDER